MSFKSFFKHLGDVAKQDVKSIGAGIKSAAHSVVSGAEDLPYVSLLPFKGMMQKELDSKGIKHSGTLHELAPLFLKHIVHEESHSFEYHNNFDLESHNIVEEVASGIITAILEFIKGLKKKAASGLGLTPTEANILNGATQVSNATMRIAKTQVEIAISEKIRKFLFSWKGIVAIMALGVLIFIVYEEKK